MRNVTGMSAELGLGINKRLGIQRRVIPIYLHIQPWKPHLKFQFLRQLLLTSRISKEIYCKHLFREKLVVRCLPAISQERPAEEDPVLHLLRHHRYQEVQSRPQQIYTSHQDCRRCLERPRCYRRSQEEEASWTRPPRRREYSLLSQRVCQGQSTA